MSFALGAALLLAGFLALAVALLLVRLRRATHESLELSNQLAAARELLGSLEVERAVDRATLAAMAECVIVLDPGRRIVSANRAARSLFSMPDPIAGRPLLELVRSAELAAATDRALGDRAPVESEIRLTLPDTREHVLVVRAVPFPRDRPDVVVCVLSDVTSERHLEQVRSDFVANVSHEFRTPLTAVRGFAETLMMEGVDDARRLQFSGTILRHARRLERLIEDLLTLSEIEAGRRALDTARVDLVPAVRETIDALQERFDAADVKLNLVAPSQPVLAWADQRALEPILQNLLENALKYTSEGGEVSVALESTARGPTLRVSDTGIGIPSRDLPRIFERFYRVDRSRSREVGGSGVGLAIVKHLVDLLGGTIEVESELERGTTFEVTLLRRPGPKTDD